MNVWITGASRGIGKAIAEALLHDGHRVAVSARTRELLETVGADISNADTVLRVPLDVSDAEKVKRAAENINEKFGSIDVLVNNAGVTRFTPIIDTSIDEFNEIIDVNLKGVYYGIRSVLPSMIERRRGWIINIISVTVKKVFTNSGAYAASKAGVLALGNVLREELRAKGIKVTSIIPGATETEMWPDNVLKKHGKRMIPPEEIGRVVASMLRTPDSVMVEEITVRPQLGDL
jgi:NADP-dependent 3-hydroxy acid dehydrogenase YdfG